MATRKYKTGSLFEKALDDHAWWCDHGPDPDSRPDKFDQILRLSLDELLQDDETLDFPHRAENAESSPPSVWLQSVAQDLIVTGTVAPAEGASQLATSAPALSGLDHSTFLAPTAFDGVGLFPGATDGAISVAALTDAAIPSGWESEIAFISGVTSSETLEDTAYWTWKYDKPATYDTESYAFKWGDTHPGTGSGEVKYWFEAGSTWVTAEQDGFLSALHLWSALADISFKAADKESDAQIVLRRVTNGSAGASAPTLNTGVGSETMNAAPTQVSIKIDTSVFGFGPIGAPSSPNSFSAGYGYVYNTLVHEVGHALGLGHGGPYNAGDNLGTIPERQFGFYDSRLWSIMSYIYANDTTAKFFGDYPVTGTA